MNIAIKIKELRESVGMTRKEFAEYTGIPIRTLEDWEAERRIPPAYVPRLLAYKLKYEKILQKNSLQNKDVNFIEDVDGLKIVLINDIRFKSRRKIDWNQIENILKVKHPELSVYRSKDTYLEIMDGRALKSNAVKVLCEVKNIPIEDTISFGDNYNDIDMLEATGMGIAMGNAPEEVKKHADKITLDNDSEGLLHMLEKLGM